MPRASKRGAFIGVIFLLFAGLFMAGLSACSDDQHSGRPGAGPTDRSDAQSGTDAHSGDTDTDADAGPSPDAQPPSDARSPRDSRSDFDWDSVAESGDGAFSLERLLPASGPVRGQNRVRLVGRGFEPGTRVFFGDREVSVDITRTQMLGQVPEAAGPGKVTVRAIAPDGEVQALVDGYEYIAGLAVTGVNPQRVPTRGGVEVSVQGSGFSPDAAVSFSGTPALRVSFVNSNLLRVLTPPRPRGPADLRVTTRAESTLTPGAITYYEELVVTEVRPASGPVAGGQPVTIQGHGFEPGMRFFFGDKPAEILRLDPHAARATLRAPAHPAGMVDLRAQTDSDSALLADAYLYRADRTPQLAALSPSVGPISGGTEVELRGYGFDRAGVEFRFGDRPATVLERGESWARVKTPAAAQPGRVDVVMRDGQGEVDRLAEAFDYQTAIEVDSLNPTQGPTAGNTEVTIFGRGFSGASRVDFGGVSAEFSVISDTEIRAQSPPHGAGTVDVSVTRGALKAVAADGFEYTEALEIWGFDPIRGAIAGDTYVEVRGQGFSGELSVFFDEVAAPRVQRVDRNLLRLYTPPHAVGEVPVRMEARTQGQPLRQADAPYPFEYFNPSNHLGGASGPPVNGSVNVSVYARGAGPIAGAFVMLSTRADSPYQGFTDENGQLTLSGPEVLGPQTVTATARDYSSATIETVDAENITVFLNYLIPDPDGGGGGGGSEIPYAIIRGNVTIQGKLADPDNRRTYDMAIVGTTRESIAGRRIDPGPGSIVHGSGPFEIISRTGDLATIALCGVYDDDTQLFNPQYMGIERYMVVSDRGDYEVDLTCDIPLDQTARVKLVNPVYSPEGPDNNVVQVYWNFGIDGVFTAPLMGRGFGELLEVPAQPEPTGALADLTFSMVGGSFTGLYAPSTQTSLEGITDLSDLLVMPPLLGVPEPVSPAVGAEIEHDTIVFSVQGPYNPDFYSVQFLNDNGLPFWQLVIPGDQRTIRLPNFPDFSFLPADQRPNPWNTSRVYMTLIGIRAAPNFSFEDFSYQDLSSDNWRAYSLTRWSFLPPGG